MHFANGELVCLPMLTSPPFTSRLPWNPISALAPASNDLEPKGAQVVARWS